MSPDTIKLFLIDDDPIFRRGFRAILQDYPDLEVIAAADTAAEALQILATLSQQDREPDLIVLELSLGGYLSEEISGVQLCQQLVREYPDLPIFVLSANPRPEELIAARISDIKGYSPKGVAIAELVTALRGVKLGQTYGLESIPTSSFTSKQFQQQSLSRRRKWLTRIRKSGLGQIEESLTKVKRQLEKERSPWLDWLFWSGRYRELLAAKWLVKRILPNSSVVTSQNLVRQPVKRNNPEQVALVPANISSLDLGKAKFLGDRSENSITATVFERTLAKIQLGVKNLAEIPLEIDILQADKKRELLYLVLNQVKKVSDRIQISQKSYEQLAAEIEIIVRDLWKEPSRDFFCKYYPQTAETNKYDLINRLLEEDVIIQAELLDKIPLVLELFAYLIYKKPLIVNNVAYRSSDSFTSLESIKIPEILIQNLIIQIANGVMVMILNNFSAVEAIKQNLYDKRFISSREIARFRNKLSWRYRQEKYFEEPKSIFESKYRLLFFNGKSIKKMFVYAPRQEELDQLSGIPWLTTIALETRDSIAPLLRSVVAFVGNGLVYVLTQVIGRGIGLIGRGIIQGIGNTLQDNRYSKNNDQPTRRKYQGLSVEDEV
ncbi:MAG: DUF3685 domain-containing protein [Prochloraceae cyanobacterium]